ncbi:MAG: hypothetical protein PHW03_02365 [Eubacteriales bacterium]|nr:hypothetical protein [Eubacteriales bacterium]MDD4389627.1 hypothetical protein [Eubacteriales bacterium]
MRKKKKMKMIKNSKSGMEMVQVGILITIAIVLGLLFKEQLVSFVENTFSALHDEDFGLR